jgi:hypothetical protein
MTRPAPIIAGTLAAFLLLFGAYMGGYYGMVERTPIMTGGFWSTEIVNGRRHDTHTSSEVELVATYRYCGDIARNVFRPANRLDRLIRRDYWGTVSGANRLIAAGSFDETAETLFKEPDIQIYEPACFSVESSNR